MQKHKIANKKPINPDCYYNSNAKLAQWYGGIALFNHQIGDGKQTINTTYSLKD